MHPDILAGRMHDAKNNLKEVAVRAAERTGDEDLVEQAKHINDRVPEAATPQAQDLIQTERIVNVLKAALGEYDPEKVPADNHFDLASRNAAGVIHDTSGAKVQSRAEAEAEESSSETEEQSDDSSYDFSPHVGEEANNALHEAGYHQPEDVKEASDKELLELEGIGPAKLQTLRSL